MFQLFFFLLFSSDQATLHDQHIMSMPFSSKFVKLEGIHHQHARARAMKTFASSDLDCKLKCKCSFTLNTEII